MSSKQLSPPTEIRTQDVSVDSPAILPLHSGALPLHYGALKNTLEPYHYTLVPSHYTLVPYHYILMPYHYILMPYHYMLVHNHYILVPYHYILVPYHYTLVPYRYTLLPMGHPFVTSIRRGQARVDACGQKEWGSTPCACPHRKLKLEPTYIILSSSHAKKLVSF